MIFRVPLHQHREILGEVLHRLAGTPLATLMTVLVLGAALALPATLLTLTDNLQRLAEGYAAPGTLNVFLEPSGQAPTNLGSRLRDQDGVTEVSHVPPQAALEEASRLLALGDALEGLASNPLPGSYTVTLAPGQRSPARMAALAREWGEWDGVDQVRFDRQWVDRFRAAIGLLERAGHITAALLGAVVVLIIGNTIRLAVANRRREIEVVKMIGGTDAFVRLPFLYQGTIQGLLGASVAVILTVAAVAALDGAVVELATRYGADLRLRGPSASEAGILVGAGAVLGWLGARLAAGRHVRALEPQ